MPKTATLTVQSKNKICIKTVRVFHRPLSNFAEQTKLKLGYMVHDPLRAYENDTWLFHGHLNMVYIQSATINYEFITFFISNLNCKNSPG